MEFLRPIGRASRERALTRFGDCIIRHFKAGFIFGSVADEVCYWRDMSFGPHFLNLLTKREIRAEVRFGQPRPADSDRKQLARELQQSVQELGGLSGGA